MNKKIEIDATKRGFPAMWETGGGLTSGGSAMLVTKRDGSKPRAVFVKTRGHRSGGPHALICVHEGYYLVYAGVARGARHSARIERIVKTSVKDVDGEKWEASVEVEAINTFSQGEWDRPVDSKLEAAVEVAFKKASIYHCRSAMYIDTSGRPKLSAADRMKQNEATVRQNAEREAKRQAKAEREAREKAETEAASQAAKESGLGDRLMALQSRLEVLRTNNPNTNYGELKLDEAYFSLGWSQKLYTEENVAQVERNVTHWEEESAERLRKQQLKDEFQPQFEVYASRVEALSLEWKFEMTEVVCPIAYETATGSRYVSRFVYSPEGLESFETELTFMEEGVVEKEHEEAAAATTASAEAEAAKLGLPQNIHIWKRTGGATGCGMGWVITSDGFDRERDGLENDNPRRASRYDEGDLVWRQILPGEVVLMWAKAYTAAEHEFEVVHLPEEDLTEAQLERIAEIQQELQDTWAGRVGLSSGNPSPPVGRGWGLGDFVSPISSEEVVYSTDSEEEPADMNEALAKLQERFSSR